MMIIKRTNLPVPTAGIDSDVATIPSASRGVVGITRNMPPKESILRMLPSLQITGTDFERIIDRWISSFCSYYQGISEAEKMIN